jgi:Immunity protein Imm1
MSIMQLHWDGDKQRTISSVEELEVALDELATQQHSIPLPYAWGLSDDSDGAPILTAVAGPERVPVSWLLPHKMERISKGDTDDIEPWLEFNWNGEYGDTEAWTLIPADQAREAARRFFLTDGQCPDNIRWATSEERKKLFQDSLPAVPEKIPGLDY